MNRTIGLISTNFDCPDLGSLVSRRPPSNVPFGGHYRLMDFALSNMVNAQIDTIGLITPYYYRSVLDHVGAGKEWDLDRKKGGLFILPGTVFGTRSVDARFLFRDIAHNSVFLQRSDADYVLFSTGNLVFNIDYEAMIDYHDMNGKPITFLYKEMPENTSYKGYYLTEDADGNFAGISDRPVSRRMLLQSFIINRGFLLRLIRNFHALGYLDIIDVIRDNIDIAQIGIYPFDGYVGFTETLQDYMHTSMDLLEPDVRRDLFRRDRSIRSKTHDAPPVQYMPGSRVSNSYLSCGSIISGTVENSIISREARIAAGAVVKNCILMDKCRVEAGAQLEYVICGKNMTIHSGTVIKGTPERPCILQEQEAI